jgi:hypothetical protein
VISDRLRSPARLIVLAIVAFVLGHNLLYLGEYGPSYQAALARTGHGTAWSTTVAIVIALGLALGFAGAVRLLTLARLARRLDHGAVVAQDGRGREALRHLGFAWIAIFILATTLFIGWENVERVLAGGVAPGLSVVTAAASPAIPLFVAIAFLAAAIDALYAWRRDVLVARIRAARGRSFRRGATASRFPDWVEPWRPSPTGRHLAGRAPPSMALPAVASAS